MRKTIILILLGLFSVSLILYSSNAFARWRTSYVYIYAFYEEDGKAARDFDVHVYDSPHFDPNRLLRAGTAQGDKYSIQLKVGGIYFVGCKKGSWAGGTSFRVQDAWSNNVKVRMQNYAGKAGWRFDTN